MRIVVVFTGGTIGSRVTEDGTISADKDTAYTLLSLYEKEQKRINQVEFIPVEPYCILSENLTFEKLGQLLQTIKQAVTTYAPDGIIVTHGTDTLQYSAAFLGYVFGGITIPIVLVSSDYVLTDQRTNGLLNFASAVSFIKAKAGQGVFVSYCNKGQLPLIHRATRLQNPISYSADVYSIKNSFYGSFQNDVFVQNQEYPVNPTDVSDLLAVERIPELSLCAGQIQKQSVYPGMRFLEFTDDCRAVVLESYHSGTIPVLDELRFFTAKAQKRNIPVFLAGLSSGEKVYETVAEYQQLGIIPVMDCAAIALYAKLCLAVTCNMELQKTALQSIAEDIVRNH